MDSNRLEQLAAKAASWIREAKDNNGSLLIATGAGMSFESGLDDITVEGFKRQFPSMAARGFRTMLECIGVDMDDRPEAGWGYQASRMKWYRETPAHAGYTHLLNLSNNQFAQRYFVFTSNVDGQHEKAGFDATKIYTRQGQYKYLQCPLPCTQDVWESASALAEFEQTIDPVTLVSSDPSLIPRCPKCNRIAFVNCNAGSNFVTKHYDQVKRGFYKFVNESIEQESPLIIIELGCGERIPAIRYPVEEIASVHPKSKLIRINPTEPGVPRALAVGDRALGIPLASIPALEAIIKEL